MCNYSYYTTNTHTHTHTGVYTEIIKIQVWRKKVSLNFSRLEGNTHRGVHKGVHAPTEEHTGLVHRYLGEEGAAAKVPARGPNAVLRLHREDQRFNFFG